MKKFLCQQCGQGYVPEIIISTLEPIDGLKYRGDPMFIEAKVIKMKRNERGESNALHVSEKILFTEYYLHSQLISKMKIFCMNALFCLKVKIIVGDKFIFGLAQGTAMRLVGLPLPTTVSVNLRKEWLESKYNQNAKDVESMSECFSKIARLSLIREYRDYSRDIIKDIQSKHGFERNEKFIKGGRRKSHEAKTVLTKKNNSQKHVVKNKDLNFDAPSEVYSPQTRINSKNNIVSPKNVNIDIPSHSDKRFSTITEEKEKQDK